MKKLFTLLIVLLFTISAFGQIGTEVSADPSLTVALDSSTAVTFYYYFPKSLDIAALTAYTEGLSATAKTPYERVYNTGDMICYGKISNVSGTESSDSLQAYAVMLGHDGYVMGGDTLWFDWDDQQTNPTETTVASGYLDFTLWSSPTLGETAYTFFINLTGAYSNCHGFKFYFNLHAGDDSGSSDFRASMEFFIDKVR